MIRVNREAERPPAVLDEPYSTDKLTEFERAKAFFVDQTRETKPDFLRYKHAAVKDALERLFHGKCAYCESFYAGTQPVDVEHYRPKGAVDGAPDHPGYWWLAMEWTNLVPSCIDCNRRRKQKTPDTAHLELRRLFADGDTLRLVEISSGKAAAFPLSAEASRVSDHEADLSGEQRLLLDPTMDEPRDHLAFHVSRKRPIGLVFPLPMAPDDGPVVPVLRETPDADEGATNAPPLHVSAMGAVSIQVYGLNRLSLVQARTRVVRDLELLVDTVLELSEVIAELEERIAAQDPPPAADAGEPDLDRRIQTRLVRLRKRIYGHIEAMTLPEAPYSAFANAWVTEYLAEAHEGGSRSNGII